MFNIEELREILKDNKLHIGLGIINKLHLAEDRSYLKVSMNVLPENREVIATMTWEVVGTNSGEFEFPSPNDLVLFAQAEGDDDLCYVIKRLTSKEDTIPITAIGGDKVSRAKTGQKYWNTSDVRINLSKGDTEPTENIVLGQRFKATYSDHLSKLIDITQKIMDQIDKVVAHDHLGNLGFKTSSPINAAEMTAIKNQLNTLKTSVNTIKSDKVDNEFILSDLTFTEKGS